jgi:hypothetical protein
LPVPVKPGERVGVRLKKVVWAEAQLSIYIKQYLKFSLVVILKCCSLIYEADLYSKVHFAKGKKVYKVPFPKGTLQKDQHYLYLSQVN